MNEKSKNSGDRNRTFDDCEFPVSFEGIIGLGSYGEVKTQERWRVLVYAPPLWFFVVVFATVLGVVLMFLEGRLAAVVGTCFALSFAAGLAIVRHMRNYGDCFLVDRVNQRLELPKSKTGFAFAEILEVADLQERHRSGGTSAFTVVLVGDQECPRPMPVIHVFRDEEVGIPDYGERLARMLGRPFRVVTCDDRMLAILNGEKGGGNWSRA